MIYLLLFLTFIVVIPGFLAMAIWGTVLGLWSR
jgi:hypothetical protein